VRDKNKIKQAYKVLSLKKDDLQEQEIEFFLFDYNSNKDAVVGTFSYTINEQPREKGDLPRQNVTIFKHNF